MTTPDQLEKLDDRVTRLEERTNAEVIALHAKLDTKIAGICTKLDEMLTILNNSLVANAKNSCPSPGACIGLGVELKAHIVAHNATMLRVERLELRMMDMEKWQGRLLGGLSVVMVVLTLFGPALRKLLNLE